MTAPHSDPPARHPLFDTLSVLLPTVEQTWLLRACLHGGGSGRAAWRAWRESVGAPVEALAAWERRGLKGLLPLLYRNLQGSGAAVDREFLPYLRTAYFREELRGRTYRAILGELLAALGAAGIAPLVLDDAALAETAYADPSLRHCHAVDLLLREGDLSRAAGVLQSSGLSAARASGWEHPSGLPVRLHSDFLPIPYYRAPLAEIWDRGVTAEIAGGPARVPAPADLLLRVCGEASCSRSRDTLNWACDAWQLVQRPASLDWDVFADAALRSGLALPLAVMLRYLAGELNAPVPDPVLRRLEAACADAPMRACEAALSGARAGARGSLRNLLERSGDWRARSIVLRWMLLPSPECLRWGRPGLSPWALLARPARYALRRAARL